MKETENGSERDNGRDRRIWEETQAEEEWMMKEGRKKVRGTRNAGLSEKYDKPF